MRSSKEITDEFTQLCMTLGNAVFNFELEKTRHMSKFLQLQQEMQEAVKVESEQNAQTAVQVDRVTQDNQTNKFEVLAGK